WESGLGLGGAAVVAWDDGSPYAATDRRTVGSFALRPSFNGDELNWDLPFVYPFVPRQNNNPAMLSEAAATCFDVVAQLKLNMLGFSQQDLAATLRDQRLHKN